jgi:hypothetical protein
MSNFPANCGASRLLFEWGPEYKEELEPALSLENATRTGLLVSVDGQGAGTQPGSKLPGDRDMSVVSSGKL